MRFSGAAILTTSIVVGFLAGIVPVTEVYINCRSHDVEAGLYAPPAAEQRDGEPHAQAVRVCDVTRDARFWAMLAGCVGGGVFFTLGSCGVVKVLYQKGRGREQGRGRDV
jgi:hypothetical protein